MNTNLKDKVVLITGSSRGIGFETAKIAKHEGAIVILNSSNQNELAKASQELANADYYKADITSDSEVKEMIDKIFQKYERVDCLVNNAGGGGWASILDDDAEWQKSFDLDILGAVHLCKYILPKMKERESGSVVNVSSMWGISATAKPEIASYCMAKASLIKLTECLAQEYGPTIRVNAVSPGWTMTKMLEDFSEEQLEKMKNEILLRRMAQPNEIAQTITFLISDLSSYITGQNISVDGGYLLSRTHQNR